MRESDKDFQSYYFELDELVDTVQQNMDTIIKTHEMSFVSSYRDHMHRVTRDLEKFKKALNEKEFTNKRDEMVTKLQGNVEWFKNEAL